MSLFENVPLIPDRPQMDILPIMSLDVYLYQDNTEHLIAADFLDDHGFYLAARFLRESEPKRFYEANITHNLGEMAEKAGIYKACWRPEEIGITRAGQLIQLLEEGLKKLQSNPLYYRRYNASNGWGTYDNFVPWVEKYLQACRDYPDALVKVSR